MVCSSVNNSLLKTEPLSTGSTRKLPPRFILFSRVCLCGFSILVKLILRRSGLRFESGNNEGHHIIQVLIHGEILLLENGKPDNALQ